MTGPGNRVTCLYVGAGSSARSQAALCERAVWGVCRVECFWSDPLTFKASREAFLAAEETALPTVLCNAATAIEVWLSEADLGLVMRFVNRPEVYEMPPGWPYAHQVLEDTPTEALPEAVSESEADSQDEVVSPEEHANGHDEGSAIVPQSLIGASPGEYVLFDLNRDNVADIPDVATG
ncbi:unnamed protein product [Symbiodinium natans]|uniref:Uncharacterized protein n=1 Tax=Symbiodinium natans TaxID=878477 RepID=A0A812RPB1_9DINO|nr:unnamed protein product [Symbiodinium natans]